MLPVQHTEYPFPQVRVEEELAFIDSSSIFGRIVAVGATWHQPASSGGWQQ